MFRQSKTQKKVAKLLCSYNDAFTQECYSKYIQIYIKKSFSYVAFLLQRIGNNFVKL